MEFNDVVDFDTRCGFADRKDVVDCEKVIKAGTPHYCMNKEIGGSPERRFRWCRNCVRGYNWSGYKEGPVLVKVELTYSDGSRKWLEGEEALDWQDTVISHWTMAYVHGVGGAKIEWKEEK